MAEDVLDQFAKADPKEVIAMLLWKDRYRNPDMTVQITEKDIESFRACTAYLDVVPGVKIERPQGLPAQAAVPESGNRRAVPARAAEPPRPFVVVQVVELKTGDAIRPIESDEEGAKLRDRAEAQRRAREAAPDLAAAMRQQAQTGNFSSSLVAEAAEALAALAKG